MISLYGLTALLLTSADPAAAQAIGDYLNLSYTGDGETPSGLERLAQAAQRAAPPLAGPAGATASGDATYAIPIAVPPALLAPTVSLSYQSGGGLGREGRGWSLDLGTPTIREPVGREAGAYSDVPGVRLVQGGGFSGLLVPDAGGYRWVSSTPGAVVALRQGGNWTLRRDGVTFTLAPHLGDFEYHTVSQVDGSGNRIDYIWSGTRIDTIWYGSTSLANHHLGVDFAYGAAAHVLYEGRGGVLSTITDRLRVISVFTSFGHAEEVDRIRYELDYDSDDELLLGVTQNEIQPNLTVGSVRQVASFEYTTLVEYDWEEDTEAAPARLARSYSGGGSSDGPSPSGTSTAFVDASGDGLPDFVSAYGGWDAGWQRLDPLWPDDEWDWTMLGDLVDRWWEDPTDVGHVRVFDDPIGGPLDETMTVVVYEDQSIPQTVERGTYALRRFLDVDGDGYQDVLETAEVPDEWNPTVPDDYSALNGDPTPTTWTVWYGSATGYGDVQELEDAPFRFPRVSTRPDLYELRTNAWPDGMFFEDATVDLMDVDGDGWLDVVQVESVGGTGVLRYWSKVPSRGGGWAAYSVSDPVLPGLDSTQRSLGEVIDFDDGVVDHDGWSIAVPSISFLNALTGFRDLNGDGALDYVNAVDHGENGVWQVNLGKGDGTFDAAIPWPAPVGWLARTDEGRPWVSTCTIDPVEIEPQLDLAVPLPDRSTPGEFGGGDSGGGCSGTLGWPQTQVGGLLDVDGDGRQDLVHGEAELWYRNLGDGFESTGRPTPGWMPVATVYGGLDSVILSSSWTHQIVAALADPSAGNDSASQQADTQQLLLVADVDRDGLPDVVDLRSASSRVVRYSGRPVDAKGIHLGYRPGLLERVETGAGAAIEIRWRSSGVVAPSGAGVAGQTPTRKDLVGRLHVQDEVSGWGGTRWYEYENGVVEHGRWLGFTSVSERDTADDPYDRQMNDGFEVAPLGETHTTYELDRDWALPLVRRVWTDRNASWVYGRAPANEDVHLRRRTSWQYDVIGAAEPTTRWPSVITVDEYSERRSDLTVPDDLGSYTVEIEYDAVGNVVEQTHSAEDRPQDLVVVATDWVSSVDGSLWRPRHASTSSAPLDPTVPPPEEVEAADFGWDGGAVGSPPTGGRLTLQDVCGGVGAGLCGVADRLTWQFMRTPRGAVAEILAPASRNTYNDAFDFGEAVVTEQRNALSHLTHRVVDDLGRVTEETDPNGVVRRTTYDAFGRTVKTEVKGAGAAVFRPDTTTVWHDEAVPNWSETLRTTVFTDATTLTSWLVTSSSYVVYDGFGRELQTWSEADAGWVVTERETDVRGNLRWTSEPHVETVFSTDYASTVGTSASLTHVDLFGHPIHTWQLGSGYAWVDRPTAFSVRTAMEEQYEREERYDTHGRLVEVLQGRPSTPGGPLTRTGAYTYDGQARVRLFTDGNGNQWKYDFDGAGRVRQVSRRGPGGGVWSPYYGFEWDGPDPARTYEGDLAGPLVVEWSYDDLGRTTQKDVWDPATGLWQAYAWSWDTKWKGARDSVTDPWGTVQYTYAPDPLLGGFGWPTQTVRTWTDGTVAAFAYAYDNRGRVTRTTWPSGAVVDSIYHANGWLDAQSVTHAGGLIEVDHQYDTTWGLPSGWVVDAGGVTFEHDVTRIDSATVASLAWSESTGAAHTLAYDWYDNGWLREKRIDVLEPFAYTYDDLGRIHGIWDGGVGGTPLEAYGYDTIGNPQIFHQQGSPSFDWAYDPPAQFNEITHRARSAGAGMVHDDMTYDPVTGRLTSWDTTFPPAGAVNDVTRDFQYDGAGRLRWIDRTNGAGALRTTRLRYDVDDQIVHETASAGAVTSIYRFSGWRKELPTGRVIESVLPMVRLDGGVARIAYLEPDGHAMWTMGTGALTDTHEVLGAYGLPLYGYGVPATPWVMDHLHGAEADRDDEVVHYGARHMLLRDGLWMQPEPLLHLGLTNGNLRHPLAYGGLYAVGNTNRLTDRDGYDPGTLVDGASFAVGVYDTAQSGLNQDPVGVVIDGNFAAVDLFGLLVPGLSTAAFTATTKAAVKEVVSDTIEAAGKALGDAASEIVQGASKGAGAAVDSTAGRAKNNLKPDSTAKGPHSTFKTDANGNTTNHAEWTPNSQNPSGFDQVKRVDVEGKSHYNKVTGEDVPTPHTHEKGAPGGVRPATPDEVP